jgi:GalNAc-alpha-(1->4)-GalNAc-alpha-(1->3)-diNAcBac-PP-undecaprenol alpha-1,4-N-acetyl-D-galactosaminyltransferase
VVLVIGSLQGGGAERQMADMANFWAAKDWNVVVATWSGPEAADFYPLDARVVRRNIETRLDAAAGHSRIRMNLDRVWHFRKLLTAVRPEVVLSFLTESNVLTILAAAALDIRVVVSERVQPALHLALPKTWRVLRRLVYRWADAVVAQTGDTASWLQANCGTAVTVIPNALRRLPESSGQRGSVIVAVGRLTYQKGFDVLLRAFAQIAPRFADWTVAIVGEGEDRELLMRLRGELLLDERVQFTGQTADVGYWMNRAGLVVQPSRYEGFPNVVLESMGYGAAVISANCRSGPSDLIVDGVNGRLVPVDDVDALATAMADLMSRPDERARLGHEASNVRERFRQDAVMKRWEQCLFPHRTLQRTPCAD